MWFPILVMACFLSHPASAKKPAGEGVPIRVTVVDATGAPVPTAVVRHPEEADRHRVNAATGEWEASALYLPDGSDLAFVPGMTLELEVSAPGYLTQVLEHEVRKRKNRVEIVLEAIDLDAADESEPLVEFGRDRPRDDALSAPAHGMESIRRRTARRVAVLVALAGSGAAAGAAATWSSFEPAFPPFPCPDGWSSCIVGGAVLAPGAVKDLKGRPHAADMRIGFWEFDPLPALSPFEPLSPYDGRRQVLRPADHPIDGQTPATPRVAPPVAPTPKTAAKIEGDERGSGTPVAMVAPIAPPPIAPTRPDAIAAEPAVADLETVAPTEANAECDDLASLESPAMMGQLSAQSRSCLEGRIGSAPQPTTRGKASRILLSDSEARGDKTEWQRLMKRHLEDIDRSDPNLCLKYAMFLSRGGTGDAWGVIRWSNYALENKQAWSGATYTKYVFQLHRLRAQAATRLWQDAEKEFVTSRAPDVEAEATKRRGVAKDYAREWLDYARASGQETKDPSNLCVSAAGNAAFCE